jgi:hypothetical protein
MILTVWLKAVSIEMELKYGGKAHTKHVSTLLSTYSLKSHVRKAGKQVVIGAGRQGVSTRHKACPKFRFWPLREVQHLGMRCTRGSKRGLASVSCVRRGEGLREARVPA